MRLSFWEKQVRESKLSIAVVGGGLVGQSAAYFLRQKYSDADIHILERAMSLAGASTRNAGFACIGSPTEILEDLKIEAREQVFERMRRRYSGLQLLRKILGDTHIDYVASGGYELFDDPKVYEQACDLLPEVNEYVAHFTGEKEVYRPGKLNGYDVVSISIEGGLQPAKMMQRLEQLNQKQKIGFFRNTKVTEINTTQGIISISGREIKYDLIVVATNAFTQELLPDLSITPGRGYVFVTKPLPTLKWKGIFHYDRGYFYFRNIGNRLLLGGARNIDIKNEETTDFDVNPKIKKYLMHFAREKLSLPKGWEIDTEWSGIMGFTPSKSPVLKKMGKQVIVAAGLSGMGVALGMQLGKEAAELSTDL